VTAVRQVYIQCDGHLCGDATGEYDADTVAEARAIARRCGYTRAKDGSDLCQTCTEKERDERNTLGSPDSRRHHVDGC